MRVCRPLGRRSGNRGKPISNRNGRLAGAPRVASLQASAPIGRRKRRPASIEKRPTLSSHTTRAGRPVTLMPTSARSTRLRRLNEMPWARIRAPFQGEIDHAGFTTQNGALADEEVNLHPNWDPVPSAVLHGAFPVLRCGSIGRRLCSLSPAWTLQSSACRSRPSIFCLAKLLDRPG